MATKSPRDMTNAQIESRIEAIDKQLSKLGDKLIDAGRGHETISETVKKTDPLSQRYKKYIDERRDLRIEAELRYGPGYTPGALRRVKVRRRNPTMANLSTAQKKALARGRAKLKAMRRRGETPKRKTTRKKNPPKVIKVTRTRRHRNPDPALMRTGVLRSPTKAGKKRLTNPPHYVVTDGKRFFDGAGWTVRKQFAAQYTTQKVAKFIGQKVADATNKQVYVVPV